MSSLDDLLDIYLLEMMEEELWHDGINKIVYLNRRLVREKYKRKHRYWVHIILHAFAGHNSIHSSNLEKRVRQPHAETGHMKWHMSILLVMVSGRPHQRIAF